MGWGRRGFVSKYGDGPPYPPDESADALIPPLTDEDVEALLSGRPGPAGSETLAQALTAASRPGLPHELTGYDQVRRAFQAVEASGAIAGSLGVARRAVSRFVAAKIASVVAAVAVLSVAGVMTAAAANKLPSPVQHFVHDVFGGVGVPEPSNPKKDGKPSVPSAPTQSSRQLRAGTPAPSSGADVTRSQSHMSDQDSTSPTRSSSSIELCNAYKQGKDSGDDSALTPTQLKQLTRLAGGVKLIDSYCRRVLKNAEHGDGSDGNSHSAGSDDSHKGDGKGRRGDQPRTSDNARKKGGDGNGGEQNGVNHRRKPEMLIGGGRR